MPEVPDLPNVRSFGWLTASLGTGVFALALGVFAFRIDSEPIFVDEGAFLSQSYFGDLLIDGQWSSPLWLEYPAYDLPPLPKYLINASLRLHGLPRPGREWMIRWYQNTKEARFVTPDNLRAARWPSVLLGAIGCLAIFGIGAIVVDREVGFLAAALLAINPLYSLHARRAMADVPTEALVLLTLVGGLLVIRHVMRRNRLGAWGFAFSVLTGVFAGLAVLTKLNGGLGLMIVVTWLGVLPLLRRPMRWRIWAGCYEAILVVCATSLMLFVVLNPFVTCRPNGVGSVSLAAPRRLNESIPTRIVAVVKHRAEVSQNAKTQFTHDALRTIPEKLAVLAVQGFGRFGPFGPRHSDSTRRFDLAQDWGAFVWIPLVLAGLVRFGTMRIGRDEGSRRYLWWPIPLSFLVALVTVGLFLPLAWDRYLLPIQAGSCLLAAGAIAALFDYVRSHRATR